MLAVLVCMHVLVLRFDIAITSATARRSCLIGASRETISPEFRNLCQEAHVLC